MRWEVTENAQELGREKLEGLVQREKVRTSGLRLERGYHKRRVQIIVDFKHS